MKTLETQFTDRGFTFTQVIRRDDLAVFHKQRVNGRAECWEVVRIGTHNGFEIAGKKIAPAETYPPSTAWGTHGWTLHTEEAARQKMSEIEAERLSEMNSEALASLG